VFDTGVRTVLGNVDATARPCGYARIPEPGACAFCLMLATRGAVYKADRKGRVANGKGKHAKGTRHSTGDSFAASNATKFDGRMPSSIKVHDNCRCHPEPVFTSYEPSARVRAADALWIAAAKGSRSTATKRFRQAVEGRIPADDKAFTDEQRALISRLRPALGSPPVAKPGHIYHWKHGWIPITPRAAMVKAKGRRNRPSGSCTTTTSRTRARAATGAPAAR
jgi:hypothetical protein